MLEHNFENLMRARQHLGPLSSAMCWKDAHEMNRMPKPIQLP